MAKLHKLSSSWEVVGGLLKLRISAVLSDSGTHVGSFDRSVNMAETFGAGYTALNETGRSAIEFGAFTALRNSTGACETLDEAAEAIDRRLSAWADGNWGSEREQSATPFSENHVLARAVERATRGAQSAAEAAAKLCEIAEAACAANGLAPFAQLEPAERAKIRKAVVDQIREQRPVIAAAYAAIELERAEEAKRRKAAEAAKLAEGVGEEMGL